MSRRVTLIIAPSGALTPLRRDARPTDPRKALTVFDVPADVPQAVVVQRAATLGLLPYGPWTVAYDAMRPGRILHGAEG